MHEQPLVSIIIPTYNRAHLIGETLDSVLTQTYTHWECIVVDDGSTDETSEVMQPYLDKDPRFQYHHRPKNRPKGANACRNYGFKLSKGKYIQWLDSDDLIKCDKLAVQISRLHYENPDVISTCDWYNFKKTLADATIVDCGFAYQSFNEIELFLDALGQRHGFFPPHTYLMSKSLIKSAGEWREDLQINQDGEFMSRIFACRPKIAFCKTAVYYREPSFENTSIINSREKAEQLIYSWELIKLNLSKIEITEPCLYLATNFQYLKLNIERQYPELDFLVSNNKNSKKPNLFRKWLLSLK